MTNLLTFRSPFSVGLDRVINDLKENINQNLYPPHDIIRSSDTEYQIVLAVAGFSKADVKVTTKDGKLVISGQKSKPVNDENIFFVYNGISNRSFSKTFTLNDQVVVKGATLQDGLLTVEMVRQPVQSSEVEVAIN